MNRLGVDEQHDRFWQRADQLVAAHPIVIDRPGGSSHPRFPDIVYPFDHGYLDGTGVIDGDGVDCWRGSLPGLAVTGAIVTVDVVKADSEVKWLVGCTAEEMDAALATHRTEWQSALLIGRNGWGRVDSAVHPASSQPSPPSTAVRQPWVPCDSDRVWWR